MFIFKPVFVGIVDTLTIQEKAKSTVRENSFMVYVYDVIEERIYEMVGRAMIGIFFQLQYPSIASQD